MPLVFSVARESVAVTEPKLYKSVDVDIEVASDCDFFVKPLKLSPKTSRRKARFRLCQRTCAVSGRQLR